MRPVSVPLFEKKKQETIYYAPRLNGWSLRRRKPAYFEPFSSAIYTFTSYFNTYFQLNLKVTQAKTPILVLILLSSTIISKISSTFQHFQLNLKATQPKTTILVLILLSSTILSKRNFIFQHISS
jgi:hypothetical protein